MRLSAVLLLHFLAATLPAQTVETPSFHGELPTTVAIENVVVVQGDGTPAYGPTTVYLENGRIAADRIERPEVRIDGAGHWLLPGLVSTHAHLHTQRTAVPMEPSYLLALWTASGITTVRDLGSVMARSVRIRQRVDAGDLPGPRILLYQTLRRVVSPEDAVAAVDAMKSSGVDGIKIRQDRSLPRPILAAVLGRAKEQGLMVTAHIGVGPTDAVDHAELGVRSIEHWYGIPEAAMRHEVQDFEPGYSYSDEVLRFRYAGKVWSETDPEKLDAVLQYMVDRGVAWSPTLAVYEACRDLTRAENLPWFDDYLHPAVRSQFEPDLATHGSFFIGWTTADEVAWRENYRIWMGALRRFAEMGGTVTTGEDAGYIYLLYGFGLVRELELHLEAGFRPLEVIRHATWNGAVVCGMQQEFGRILPGTSADLILVRGNPLENMRRMYPIGTDMRVDGERAETGGVTYTIARGRIWHGPTLMQDVRRLVEEARKEPRGGR